MELPSFHIQPDFENCINDVKNGRLSEEKFYINIETNSSTIKDYNVGISRRNDVIIYDAGLDNTFSNPNNGIYEGTFEKGKYKCQFKLPVTNYTSLLSPMDNPDNNIFSSFDITTLPEKRLAIGESTGEIKVFKDFELTHRLNGHKDYITSLRFFPSGEVLLSSSIDMRLKIWSAVDGSNPRTLLGHIAAVTDTAIIERGRNILSCSRDGTVKLWDCGSGNVIRTFRRTEMPTDPINVINLNVPTTTNEVNQDSGDFSTSGKTVLAAHSSGIISHHDISSKAQIGQCPNQFNSSCTSISLRLDKFKENSSKYVYAGYENGCIAQWDMRNPNKAVSHVYINKNTPVKCLLCCDNSLYLSSDNESACQLSLDENGHLSNIVSLVTHDAKILQFKANVDTDSVWAVGTTSYLGKYKV
ncbi:HFL007Wp [Eremothecium sinecaudum]|uniref:HFL007Wp n=1 Tax=Eremothecium sinecaudum TaxID=45286 RepID=A0A0X8HUV4_9SACH|nr:HFL007Wp [Eremothecium sinecaudum]AMD21849.1 HFL007Wp [Eremothecium sinecaudum]